MQKITKELGLLMLLFTVLFLWVTQKGLLKTNDSLAYLASSQSLLENFTLRDQNGGLFVYWTPLYSVLLSFTNGLVVDFWSKMLNWMGAMFTLFFVYQIIQRKDSYFQWLILGTLSTPFLMVNTFLWSESIFIAIFMAHCYYLQLILREEKKKRWWFVWYLTASILCLQRNVGIFIVGADFIFLAMFYFAFFKKGLIKMFLLFLSLIPWLAWTIYTSLHKVKELYDYDFASHVFEVNTYFQVFPSWFLPLEDNTILGLCLGGIILMSVMSHLWKEGGTQRYISLQIFAYLSAFCLLHFLYDFGEIDDAERYMSILFFPILIGIISFWNRTTLPAKWKYVIFVLVFIYNMVRTGEKAWQWHHISIQSVEKQ